MIYVNGRGMEYQEGLTIQGLIKQLKYTYPVLIVSVNGTHVPKDVYHKVVIQNSDDIKIIHPIAGG